MITCAGVLVVKVVSGSRVHTFGREAVRFRLAMGWRTEKDDSQGFGLSSLNNEVAID